MTKIAVVGAPSSGKTVLARRLTNTLSLLGYGADSAIEYARTYLFRYVKPAARQSQDLLDQVMIYLGQRRREEDLRHCDFVVCDSATFLPYVFACFWGFDLKDPRDVMVVHKLFKWSLEEIATYDFIFHIPPRLDYKPKAKAWKVSTKDERADIARRIEDYLLNARVPHHDVTGDTPETREKFVLDVLAKKVDGLRDRLAKHARG
ncbi:MAG: ATP-binding protein [Planctomycetes bacterium]|nr:ATP-binding protein [Planctomycetota bacterium]